MTAEDWRQLLTLVVGFLAVAYASWWAGYMQAQEQAAKHPLDELGECP